ncbi:endonuclease/exonuclease/phosphatase family protein [Kaistella faecalis]|uniref:endonuclease/exonuclease/phosphatase family protein n=1 Tax=Kaistella faecalis TaxID=2852098 RepID=UPI001C438521|nr:endonuclease/exonuclease/phosphatase family protein [Chryseobacterium faecale]UFK98900.1 endonuclease [Chryseobacterium faecale]
MKKIFITIALFSMGLVFSQKVQVQRAAIAFYNVENLWDTVPSADYIDGTKDFKNPAFHRSVPIDSLQYLETTEVYKGEWSNELLVGKKVVRNQILADDFTANSGKNWNAEKYNQKMANVSKVLSELGRQYTNDNPAVIGLVEVENRQVIEDLIKQPALAKSNYGIIHHNSYDARGVDVGLIYQKGRFVVTDHYEKEIKTFNDDGYRSYTRGVLVVKGLLDGEKYAFFVNHWPSRSGGEARSYPRRAAAATVLKTEMDRLRAEDPSIKLVAMGDFNDDPVSPSIRKVLGAVGEPTQLSDQSPYYNLMNKMYKSGVATLGYRDAPNLFDQMIASKNLHSTEKLSTGYSLFKTEVYAPAYLKNSEGQWKGYPLRSWDGDRFTNGYSDHFPVFTVLQREHKSK